jgi:hypothetical protein
MYPRLDRGKAVADDRHVFHASTYEEATELLLRWAIEGVDCKIGGMPKLGLTSSGDNTDSRPIMGEPYQRSR